MEGKQEQAKCGEQAKDGATRGEIVSAGGMGCGPSQAVIIQPPPAKRNLDLQPTIFMVADKSFQLLQEIGELKFYQLAQYGEAEEIENRHGEFACRLENPVEFVKNELQSSRSGNDQTLQTSAEGHTLGTKNLKTTSIVTRIFNVEEKSTEVSISSIGNLPDISSTEARRSTLVTTSQGFTNTSFLENAADTLENPVLFQRSTAAANDVSPRRSKNPALRSCASPQKPCTSKPKGKMFFGRNRAVTPRSQGDSNHNRCLQPLSSRELKPIVRSEDSEEAKETAALDEENAVQEITLQQSAMSNPACCSDTNF